MAHQRVADYLAGPGYDVDDAGRRPDLLHDPGKRQGGKRRILVGF
jgi:hypothetical protein